MEYNRIRKDWIKYKPKDWTLQKLGFLSFAASLFDDKELLSESYDSITDYFIKL
jgi:hypothetical protein